VAEKLQAFQKRPCTTEFIVSIFIHLFTLILYSLIMVKLHATNSLHIYIYV